MTEAPISPLRRRMIEDMTMRKFAPRTQEGYIRAVKGFSTFLGASPDTASFEDLRRYQLHLVSTGIGAPTINHTTTALRFLFMVTSRRPELVAYLPFVREPRRLPVVLSPEEVARLLNAAPGLKYRAALSIAYGAGLRASEIISLKLGDIDSARMVIRVEQGKGRKDRYVMLSQHLLDLLRAWWRVGRPQGWLFPGQNPVNPPTHAASAQPGRSRRGADGRDRQARPSAHAAALLRHAPPRAEDRYPRDPGTARVQETRYDGALHARRPQGAGRGHQPARASRQRDKAARVKRGRCCPAHRSRLRTSSAATDRLGAKPTPVM